MHYKYSSAIFNLGEGSGFGMCQM